MGQFLFLTALYVLLLHSGSIECHRYLGCYRENIERRLFEGDRVDFRGTLTPEKCISHCKEKKFSYAGLQYGYKCFCSNDRPSFKEIADEDECNTRCEGDEKGGLLDFFRKKTTPSCGGALRISVHDIADSGVNHVLAHYLGCYSDDGEESRALRGKKAPDRNEPFMTPEYCTGFCYGQGYKYAGVQYRRQCFCGNQIQGKRAEEAECELLCAGDPRLKCGGHWRRSVYRTTLSGTEKHRFMGCYKEKSTNDRLMKGDFVTFRGTLTAPKCKAHCQENGFTYAGLQYGNECFCSNERPSFKELVDLNECDTKCEGDSSQTCGGALRISVHDIADSGVNHVLAHYLGCYSDDGESRRALQDKASPERNEMTPEYCTGFCYGQGYKYAGVQYARQCFCGNEIKGPRAEEGDCSMECAGDSRLTCGGDRRSNVYNITALGTESARFMGCYKENSVEARLMNGDHKDFKRSLTPEKCINHCKSKGFSYAGLQYGYECFCSEVRPSFKVFADISECNTKCEGDQSKKCGGNLRLSVYDIDNKRVNYVQANYVGCYADDGENRRALREKASPERNEMTPEFCTGYCYSQGYRYAGVQYGRQCFCGDEIKGERASEGECDQDCAGDSRLICGGGWKNSVYHTSISDESEDGRLIGCFVDSSEFRLLSGHEIKLKDTNTPRKCMNICLQLGFKFSGVEDGTECFCGNRKPEAAKETGENECLTLCPNSRLRACGGSWRLAIYSTSSIVQQPPVIFVPAVGNQVTDLLTNPGGGGGGGGSHTLTVVQQPAQPQITRRPIVLTSPTRPTTTEYYWPQGSSGSEVCTTSKTEHSGKSICKGDLLFHEKFNSWTPGTWKHEMIMPDGPDYEFVVYDDNRENIFLQGGKLNIKPTIFDDEFVRRGRLRLEKCTGKMFTEECEREGRGFSLLPPVRSARITTKDSFTFKYGKIVINARLPVGDWVLPEIWLEPKDHVYGPGYHSGRIRIAHSNGNRNLVTANGEEIGSRRLESGILMGSESRIRGRKRLKPHENNRGWFEDFHNYTLIWSPENLSFQVDNEEKEDLIPPNAGKLYKLVGFDKFSADQWDQGSTIAPFDQQFYISLGVSVGGMREFPDNCLTGRGHAKPWSNMAVKGLLDFWNDRDNWFPTWSGNKFGLEVADVYVYAL